MATKKNVTKEVEVKETKVKFDSKAFAESLEKAFKSDKRVDVIADTNLEFPKSVTYSDYSYIHFYKKGTTKDMFGVYVNGKTTRFALALSVEEFISASEDMTITDVLKKKKGSEEKSKVAITVTCPTEHTEAVAKTIIDAYMARDAKKAEDKKEEPKKKEVVAK